MVVIKTAQDIETMKQAGRISAGALRVAREQLRDGVTTAHVDDAVEAYIRSQGATPTFLGYCGYPKTTNISINNQVIHGIPNAKTVIRNGDIVSIDVGACYQGFHGDNAATFAVGEISGEAKRLMNVTRESLRRGIAAARKGNRIGDISNAVQSYVEANGFSVVRDYVGHGVGRELHEAPEVPNFGKPGHGLRLVPGMTIAIEPMVNEKGYAVCELDDGWTIVTRDGGLSAHYENTVLITEGDPIILTRE